MITNATKLPSLLEKTIQAGITSFIHGPIGAGKSQIVKTLADKFNLHFIDIRLSQLEPVDLSGMPTVNEQRTKASYLPMDMFPIEGDAIPEGKKGFLIFLDEANQCSKAIQSAAFQLTLDKTIGQYKLHKRTAIILAGNDAKDSTVVSKLAAPLLNRLAHFELAVDKAAWIKWADANEIDHRIKSYLNFKPQMLHKYDKSRDDKGFPTPRTWEFASRLINHNEELDEDSVVLLSSVLGEGTAREFYSYISIFTKLPTIEDIMKNPEKVNIPREPATHYALSGMVGDTLEENNIDTLMKFIKRLPIEFQIFACKAAISKRENLIDNKTMVAWKIDNVSHLAN